ncbi:MAG TPA: hypothetical protein ENN09_01920 [Planctomycetes bacterium]|nr:hypothetical protein [Planctomycetota bacterium]
MIVAGMDEAGYGPKLGPFVAAAAAFCVPAEQDGVRADADAGIGAVRALLDDFPVRVADSKRLYSPKKGLAVLEKSALALLGAAGVKMPLTRGLLVETLFPGRSDEMTSLPWYAGVRDEPLPFECGLDELLDAVEKARTMLAGRNIGIMTPCAAVVDERALNRMWRERPGKETASLYAFNYLSRKITAAAERPVHMTMDQQGGRRNYLPWLAECFPGAMAASWRTDGGYAYHMRGKGVRLFVSPGADGLFPEVAAASIIAKYVREVLMRGFYSFWGERGVAPADGYAGSWRAFIQSAAPHIEKLGLDRGDILRIH